jgi:nicotinamide-nucleotide amidase
MKAALLTIGEEILIGQIVDTNSAWIAQHLNMIGVSVKEIVSISDSGDDIKYTVKQLLNKYDIVISTGGLGPTSDDITKQTLCELFNAELVMHEPTLEHIRNIFAQRGLALTELNSKQAEVPANCEVLFNPNGTAPGMWFNQNGKILAVIPGVPFEMEAIMELHILPRINTLTGGEVIVHKTIQTFGLPESFLAEKLSEWELNLPKSISLAYLPSPMSIRLRLSSKGSNKHLIEQEIERQAKKLQQVIPNNIFGFEHDTMASVVGNLLSVNNLTIAVAESCTGGNIAHMITQVPGSSKYFLGGIVSYANNIKTSQLGVSDDLISTNGAVSQEVVEAMAKGVMEKFNSDYSIATSGIAGPSGATPTKPVGTVWVAICSQYGVSSQLFNFGGDRERNIIRSSVAALNMLRLQIEVDKKLHKRESF